MTGSGAKTLSGLFHPCKGMFRHPSRLARVALSCRLSQKVPFCLLCLRCPSRSHRLPCPPRSHRLPAKPCPCQDDEPGFGDVAPPVRGDARCASNCRRSRRPALLKGTEDLQAGGVNHNGHARGTTARGARCHRWRTPGSHCFFGRRWGGRSSCRPHPPPTTPPAGPCPQRPPASSRRAIATSRWRSEATPWLGFRVYRVCCYRLYKFTVYSLYTLVYDKAWGSRYVF